MNHREELYVLGWVMAALIVASAIAWLLRLRAGPAPNAVLDNLTARIKAWWIMILLLAGAFLAGHHAVIVLFGLVSFAALREFITLAPTQRADHAAVFISFFIVLPMQYWLVWVGWYGFFAILIPVYAFLALPIAAVMFGDTNNFLARTAETQWGVMICIYCISHVPAMLNLDIPGYRDRNPLLVLFLLVVVQSSDVLQYVWGKLLGRHKIAPSLSPSKTVEGFAGGIASATLVGTALYRITPFSPLQAAGMSLVATLMAFFGGLVMSAIKRDRGVKDWGHLIEGHGGILDRLDSVAFSAPIVFHLIRYFFVP
jgi:phosphatidate cytidylyltransferase